MDLSPSSIETKIIEAAIECLESTASRDNQSKDCRDGRRQQRGDQLLLSQQRLLIQRCMEVTLEHAFGPQEFADLPEGTAGERCKAMFNHLFEGGSRYPGLTRAHFL